MKVIRRAGPSGASSRRPLSEEALEVLATVVLAHVPVEELNLRPKAIYIAVMVRRVLMAMADDKSVDDRDYVGNKRLELSVFRSRVDDYFLTQFTVLVNYSRYSSKICSRSSITISRRTSTRSSRSRIELPNSTRSNNSNFTATELRKDSCERSRRGTGHSSDSRWNEPESPTSSLDSPSSALSE